MAGRFPLFGNGNGVAPEPDPVNGAEAWTQATGFELTEYFGGDSLTGQILAIVLAKANGAIENQSFDGLLRNPGKMGTTAYNFPATNGTIISDGTLGFGTGSFYVEVVARGALPTFSFANLIGNLDGLNGFMLRTNLNGDFLAELRISGEPTVLFSMPDEIKGPLNSYALLVDRDPGQSGKVRVATLRRQMEDDISAGTMTTSVPLTMGDLLGSGSAWRDRLMSVRLILDPTNSVLKGVDPIDLLQAAAKNTHWGPVRSTPVDDVDIIDYRRGEVARLAKNATMVIGETLEDIVNTTDLRLEENVRVIGNRQDVLTSFDITALDTLVTWTGFRAQASMRNSLFFDISVLDRFKFTEPAWIHVPQSVVGGDRTSGNRTYIVQQTLFLGATPIASFEHQEISGAGDTILSAYNSREPTDFAGMGDPADDMAFIAQIKQTTGGLPTQVDPLAESPELGIHHSNLQTFRGEYPLP